MSMFLHIYWYNEVQGAVKLQFGRNQEIVQKKFFEVLTTTELLACDYINTPTRQELCRIPKLLQMGRIGHILANLLELWMRFMYGLK